MNSTFTWREHVRSFVKMQKVMAKIYNFFFLFKMGFLMTGQKQIWNDLTIMKVKQIGAIWTSDFKIGYSDIAFKALPKLSSAIIKIYQWRNFVSIRQNLMIAALRIDYSTSQLRLVTRQWLTFHPTWRFYRKYKWKPAKDTVC